jgi:hypothetical protein
MRPVEIEFVPQPRIGLRLGVPALVLACAVLAATLWDHASRRNEVAALEAQLDGLRAAAARRPAQADAPAPVIAEGRVRAINGAIARLNLPWPALFGLVEASTPKEVALIALEPDGRRRSLVVQAETLAPATMLAFVERLRADAIVEDVFLVRHEQREQEPGRPYRFAVEVRWKAGV